MMEVVISEEVSSEIPELHVAYFTIEQLRVGTDSEKISEMIAEIAREILNALDIDRVKDRSDFRAYRDFFWSIGVDPTKTRPAAEALVRRILRGSSLPRINDFVDAYNLASIVSGVPIGAFDMEGLEDCVVLRFSRSGEEFLGIGMQSPMILDTRRLVMSSGDELIAIYPYRDADNSKITCDTRDALLISCGVPNIEIDQILNGARKCRDFITSQCGGISSKINVV